METMIGIYKIAISPDADSDAFEEAMKTDVFPKVEVGKDTRGGTVTAQYLLKDESPGSEHDYAWIVRWVNSGGSPFGSANAPNDPASQLAAFGAKTSFVRYALRAEQTE